MNKSWTSAVVVSGISISMALSACSGAEPKEPTDDVDDYCASLADTDEICDREPGSAEPSNVDVAADATRDAENAPATEQTGNAGFFDDYPGTEEM